MPRGECKQSRVLAGTLGSDAALAGRRPLAGWKGAGEEETRAAIRNEVAAFAQAWFSGDAPAMMGCLHPDFRNRVMGIRGGAEERGDRGPEGLVRSVVGLQGRFGSKTAPESRRLEVRVLDVRRRSASAVAELGGWVLHAHLARSGNRWRIVNVMWEMAN